MNDLEAISKRLIDIRQKRKLLSDQDKALSEEFAALSDQALQFMGDMGVEATRTSHASMSVSKQQMASVKDWDQFYQYVQEHQAFYLLQKRVSNKAYNEVLEMEGEVPGTEPFVKVTLNLRAR